MKRDFIVSIRLDATMKKHIEEHAKRERRTISDYLYLLLEKEIKNLEKATKNPARPLLSPRIYETPH